MRAHVSFKTFSLLWNSDTPLSVWRRHFASRVARLTSRLLRNAALEAEIATARAEFESDTRGLEFTHTWFDGSIPLWVKVLSGLKSGDKAVDVLEIGSWEGRSTVFLLGFFRTGTVTAVDTWAGGDEYSSQIELDAVERRFDANVAGFGARAIKKKGRSSTVLAEMTVSRRECFDFVFVDGSHYADDVLGDAVLSWRLLRKGGIMIFDDYLWKIERYGWKKNPAKAVNLFLRLIGDEHELLHVGNQLALRKTTSMTDYTSH